MEERRTAELVKHIVDIDFVPADSEVDAMLLESRLIKDIQPRFNSDLKDGKSFPYLQIRVREEFPRVEFTRKPRRKGVKLYGEMHRFIPIYASWQGGRVTEIPVNHFPRVHGQSKYGL